jgi:hypothetical protein
MDPGIGSVSPETELIHLLIESRCGVLKALGGGVDLMQTRAVAFADLADAIHRLGGRLADVALFSRGVGDMLDQPAHLACGLDDVIQDLARGVAGRCVRRGRTKPTDCFHEDAGRFSGVFRALEACFGSQKGRSRLRVRIPGQGDCSFRRNVTGFSGAI